MTRTKKSSFTEEDQKLARFAKALAHPARIQILRFLAEKRECICGEMVGMLPLAQSTVSQHLRELKDAGLVKGEIDGPRVCYCINTDVFADLCELLQGFIVNIDECCCGDSEKK